MKEESLKQYAFAFMLAGLLAMPAAYGATDTIFAAINTKLNTILTGTGGIMITTVSLAVASLSFLSHNYKTALGTLGVAIMSSIGPSVASSFFTAVL